MQGPLGLKSVLKQESPRMRGESNGTKAASVLPLGMMGPVYLLGSGRPCVRRKDIDKTKDDSRGSEAEKILGWTLV